MRSATTGVVYKDIEPLAVVKVLKEPADRVLTQDSHRLASSKRETKLPDVRNAEPCYNTLNTT